MEENDGKVSGPSEENERRVNAYPTVMYFLKSIKGSPNERAQKAALMLQQFFQGSNPVTASARSALREYCKAHELPVPDYLGETLLKKNGKTDLPITS